MFETKRLILREYQLEDYESYCRLRSEQKIWKYSSIKPSNDSNLVKKELLERISLMRGRKYIYGALFLVETGEFIGDAGVISYDENENTAIIGYNVLPEYWRQGYATEIVMGLISFLFDRNHFKRIEALTMQKNLYSCKLLEYTGFVKSRIIDNYSKINNQYYPVCCYIYQK